MGFFSKLWKGVKKVVKKIGRGIKKVVGKVGKFVGKLGIEVVEVIGEYCSRKAKYFVYVSSPA